LARLATIAERSRSDFDADPFLRDIAERNLEIIAQCCIDTAQRIISLESARKPSDYHDALIRLGELGILSPDFARRFAPIAGLRNVLVHEYAGINWDEVYARLQDLSDVRHFREAVLTYLKRRG
jgi:uncharacterized protein YutE (UPF0331/DUF86 family)